MGDKENEEIWKILQKEIRIKSEDKEEKNKVEEHSSEPMGKENDDPNGENIAIFIDELEKRRQMANAGSITLSDRSNTLHCNEEKGGDNGNDNKEDDHDEKEKHPFDPRDGDAEKQVTWPADERSGTEAEKKDESFPEYRRENKPMKKRLRIRQTEDSVKVRFFVGDEEFVGMSVKRGSSNAITFGGTTIFLDGDETVLEI